MVELPDLVWNQVIGRLSSKDVASLAMTSCGFFLRTFNVTSWREVPILDPVLSRAALWLAQHRTKEASRNPSDAPAKAASSLPPELADPDIGLQVDEALGDCPGPLELATPWRMLRSMEPLLRAVGHLQLGCDAAAGPFLVGTFKGVHTPQLKTLDLHGMCFAVNLDDLMTELAFSGFFGVESSLEELSVTRRVHGARVPFQDAHLALLLRLHKLRAIRLEGCEVGGMGLRPLADLPSLESLEIIDYW